MGVRFSWSRSAVTAALGVFGVIGFSDRVGVLRDSGICSRVPPGLASGGGERGHRPAGGAPGLGRVLRCTEPAPAAPAAAAGVTGRAKLSAPPEGRGDPIVAIKLA